MRVSSNQQLEADGDLSVQRQLVREYVEKHPGLAPGRKGIFRGQQKRLQKHGGGTGRPGRGSPGCQKGGISDPGSLQGRPYRPPDVGDRLLCDAPEKLWG